MIGNICLWNIQPENNKAELGYALHPNFHGKGIMQEAVEKVLQFGYTEMNLDLIDAYTSPNNAASIRLLERNKFIREEVIMEEDDDGNKTWPNAIYVLKNPR